MSEDVKKFHEQGQECGDPHCGCHEHSHEDGEAFDIHDIMPDDEMEAYTIVMEDEETGEEYKFFMADDFDFEGEVYVVLLSVEEDPEAIFAKMVTLEDGSEAFESLDDEEFERVADYYVELCEETSEDDFDDDEESEDESEDEA